MYCCTTVRGAPPQLPTKYEPDQKCPPHRYRRTWLLEGVDQLGELDFRRVVDVVLLAVELHDVGFEVRADLAHDLFAARQNGVRHGLAPVLGDEHQMHVQVVNDVAAGAYVRVGVSSW